MAGTIAPRGRAVIREPATPRAPPVRPTRPGPAGMADTGGVPAIDLNADLAEGDELTPSDLALLDVVTSASLACGFHAGNRRGDAGRRRRVRRRGAWPSARTSPTATAPDSVAATSTAPSDQLAADVVEQWETLVDEAGAVGATVAYVKAHGALYHRMASDPAVATSVVEALASRCPVLVAPPGSAVHGPAAASGVRVVPEGFCDRGLRRVRCRSSPATGTARWWRTRRPRGPRPAPWPSGTG